MSGWRPGVAAQLGFYVYLLVDPRTATPFYVGKGTGGRCFDHIAEARRTARDTVGDYPKLQAIRDIEAAGTQVRIELLRHGLDERSAFEVEAAAIDLLGLGELHNRVAGQRTDTVGRMSVDDANALYGASPVEFDPEHRLMLIRVTWKYPAGVMDEAARDEALYEATRAWWRVSADRKDLVTHALAVHDGVVRAVFAIDGWTQPTAEQVTADRSIRGRWAFHGHKDPVMEQRYLLADVTAHLSQGNQNPIRYINC